MRFTAGRFLRILAVIAFAAVSARAADSLKVWVELRDKGVAGAARDRAWEDAPVHAPYLEQLKAAGLRLSVALKWQNKVSGWADSADLAALKALPFVKAVDPMPRKAPSARLPRASSGLPKSLGVFGAFDSVFIKSGAGALRDTLATRGLRPGEGMRIAVMDEDFHLGHTAFDSLFIGGRIADQWDFVADTSAAVDRRGPPPDAVSSHGAAVLSLIAAQAPGLAVGLAPYASFLLYRTENGPSESYVEEDYLAAAFERAVDSGAQVINVSLGYRYDFDAQPDLAFSMMDGRTRPASLAAVAAARRGALVVVAIGNEASFQPSPSLTSPADADSILSIGMITAAGAWCTYSSTGNTADGRLKPELSALGCGVPVVNPASSTGLRTEAGTSVGAPVVAGIGALLRQLHPAKTAQEVRQALMITGSRSPSPDSLVGNGLVRAGQAHCALALDSLVQTPCAPPPPPAASRAVKGVFVWRGGNLMPLAWPTDVDLSRPRLWDMQGRPRKVEALLDENGGILLRAGEPIAPGPYILRIPRSPESPAP